MFRHWSTRFDWLSCSNRESTGDIWISQRSLKVYSTSEQTECSEIISRLEDEVETVTPSQRVRLMHLRWRLPRTRQRHYAVLAALILEGQHQARQQRMVRRWWVMSWLLRRVLHDQYDTLIQELMWESESVLSTHGTGDASEMLA